MTTFQIKVIAVGLMLLDHIAAFLLPEAVLLRVIGRLSFPLFAWLIANGYRHTRDVKKYLSRLFLLAALSQLPYALVYGAESQPLFMLNIFFTLFLGLAMIVTAEWRQLIPWKVGVILAGAMLAELIKADYGAAGVLTVVAFYYTFGNLRNMVIAQLAIQGIFYTLPQLLDMSGLIETEFQVTIPGLMQPISVLAVGIIALYNGQLGRPMKYAFYVFYPAHLLIIYWLQQLVLR